MATKKILTDQEMTERVISLGQEYVPEFKVIDKKISSFHKMIGRIFPSYMINYWTTIGYTAAYPVDCQYDWKSIAHEIEHARQAKKCTRPLFYWLYLLPASLMPLFIVLGFIFSPWYFIGAACSLFPIPAIFRTLLELEGYKTTIRVEIWTGSNYVAEHIEGIIKYSFGGPGYYFMWPFRGPIENSLIRTAIEAKNWKDLSISLSADRFHWGLFNLIESSGRLNIR